MRRTMPERIMRAVVLIIVMVTLYAAFRAFT